jgi:hypothetical protein
MLGQHCIKPHEATERLLRKKPAMAQHVGGPFHPKMQNVVNKSVASQIEDSLGAGGLVDGELFGHWLFSSKRAGLNSVYE